MTNRPCFTPPHTPLWRTLLRTSVPTEPLTRQRLRTLQETLPLKNLGGPFLEAHCWTLRPPTVFKKQPKFVKNMSRRLSFRVPVRGTGNCQKLVKFWKLILYLDSKRLYCRTPEKWFGAEFSVKWFGFRPESQSYRPKVGVTDEKSEIQPGRPPESEPNRPEKGPEWGLCASTENPP